MGHEPRRGVRGTRTKAKPLLSNYKLNRNIQTRRKDLLQQVRKMSNKLLNAKTGKPLRGQYLDQGNKIRKAQLALDKAKQKLMEFEKKYGK